MKWILLKADHTTYPPSVETRLFDANDTAAAFAAYADTTLGKAERDEVVLFLAESEKALRESHPRYFFTRQEIITNLRESLSSRSAPKRPERNSKLDQRQLVISD